MAKSSFAQKFGVSIEYGTDPSINPVLKIDTCQAVKKPLSHVLFGRHLPADAVKLAYVATPEIDADSNLEIVDCSRSMNENAPEFTQAEELFDTKNIITPYKEVLFTDEFTTGTITLPAAPLYYKHTLPADTDTDSIIVLDSNSRAIDRNAYEIVTVYVRNDAGEETSVIDSVVIYNSLANKYDEDNDILTAYYVQYTYASGGTRYTKTALLSNENIFREAISDDIHSETLKLKSYAKAYLIEEVGTAYRFTLPQSDTTYSAKYLDQARIYLKRPEVGDKDSPWFLKVTNGNFIITSDDDRYVYDLPEFSDQLFNPVQPYKLAAKEKVLILTPHILKLKRTNIAFTELPIDIEIRDRKGKLLYALTTDTNKAGNGYSAGTDIIWDLEKIISYDSKSGLIQIEPSLKDYYKAYVTYYYYEKDYEFTTLSFNPLFNSEMLEGFYVIYLRPKSPALASENQTASLYWLKVGSDGNITAASENALFITQLYSDWKTTYTNANYLVLGEISVHRHASSYCKQDGTRTGKVVAGKDIAALYRYHKTTILDTRQAGGGIKDGKEANAKQLNPYVSWYTDIGNWPGVPFPAQCVVVVKVPQSVLTTYGGSLEHRDVVEKVKKHLPFGHYPAIRYYGTTPYVYLDEDSTDTAQQIKIYWATETDDYTYSVYHAQQEEGPPTPAASDLANADPNSYTITGLTTGDQYWIYVTATKDSIEGAKSAKLKVLCP